MNDDLTVGSVTITDTGDYGIITSSGTITPISINASASTINMTNYNSFDIEDFLDEHIMNRVTCDHKVAGHELLKLKEVAPDYANEIKENLAKNVTRDIMKKVMKKTRIMERKRRKMKMTKSRLGAQASSRGVSSIFSK